MRISTSVLNQVLSDAQNVNPVPSRSGRLPKIYYMTQASVKPPTFILFVNEPELIHFSYMRFLENRLRESFGFEAGKGMAGVAIFSPEPNLMLLGGILAMVGHNWSVFLGFKGGRGVATGLGVLIFLVPLISAICFAIWAVIVYFTKYVSLGSIVGAALVPILMIVFGEPLWYIVFGTVAALFVILRHRENIMRLLRGQELKVERTERDDSK